MCVLVWLHIKDPQGDHRRTKRMVHKKKELKGQFFSKKKWWITIHH